MMRWFWKRWVFAAVCGTTLLAGLAAAQKSDAPPGPPKVGDVLTLPFANGVERKVKVMKSEKQPDGSYLSEVKDTKTGETFTLYDKPGDGAPPDKPAKTDPPKTATTKSNARPTDPLLPKPSATAEQSKEKEKEKERRFLGNLSIFSSKPQPPEAPGTSVDKDEERPGFLKRVFGKKPSTPAPNMPAASTSAKPIASGTGGATMPPPVRPTPGAPRNTGAVPPPVVPGTTAEPPRSRTGGPVTPPAPVIPTPTTIPAAPPVASPAPLPLPTTPAIPSVPVLPPATTVPPPSGLPAIPLPPGGLSVAKPMIVQASATVPTVMEDLRDEATTLRTGPAPSKRALAARALAGGRHGSTDTVKAMLFGTAQDDPSAMVRAVCIEELCKLGYREPAFLAYLKKACDDPHSDVSTAATDAMAKLAARK